MLKPLHSKLELPIAYAVLAGVALIIITAYIGYVTFADYSKQSFHQMETESIRVDRALIIEIEHSSHLVQTIGQEVVRMNPDDLKSIAILLRTFDTTATVHHVFSWIDSHGDNVVSSNKGVHPPVDVSDRDFLRLTTSNPWKVEVGSPIQGRVSGKWVLPVAVGVTDATGKYVGTVLISMDIYTITADLQQALKDSGSAFIVYGRNGIFPLTQDSGEEKLALLSSFSGALSSADIAEHPTGILSRANPFDKHSMFVYYESSVYPYVILMGIPNTPATLLSMLAPRIAETFVVAATLLLLFWLVQRRVIEPVAELSDVVSGMVRGEPYHDPVGNVSIAELYDLEKQIKKLDDYLNEIRLSEEENRNKNLMLRNSRKTLELSNKIKIEFLKSMSYELRTLLNIIVGFSEIMKTRGGGKFDVSQYQQYTANIHKAAKQLQRLVGDMQQLSSLEAGSSDVQEKHIDIRFIVSKVLHSIASGIPDSKLNIELKLPEIMPHLLMDEQRLEQIIASVIVNIAGNELGSYHVVVRAYPEQESRGTTSGFCIAFSATKQANTEPHAEYPSSKYTSDIIGIPLTRALAQMYQIQLESKSSLNKQSLITLHFPNERLAYGV